MRNSEKASVAARKAWLLLGFPQAPQNPIQSQARERVRGQVQAKAQEKAAVEMVCLALVLAVFVLACRIVSLL